MLSLSEWLLVLTGAFLFAHLLLDIRMLRLAVAHRKDVWLTVTTLGVLIGHIVTDYV